MFRILTIKELETEWATSEQTVRKKIKANLFEMVSKKKGCRELKAYKIPETLFLQIKNEILENKAIYSGNKNISINSLDNDSEIVYEGEEVFTEHLETNNSNHIAENAIINILKTYREDLENTYAKHYEMLIEKDKKIFLLEDSERRKEEGYLRQIADLKTENERLRKDLETVTKQLEEKNKKKWSIF